MAPSTLARHIAHSISALPLLTSLCFAQVTVQGSPTVSGSIEVNYPFTHNVQIMAFSPPTYGTPDYNNFLSNVMTQPSVDGVTLEIVWSNVEKSTSTNPSSTSCGVPSDVCQQDAVGQYHTYDWSTYDAPASVSSPFGIYSWFNPFGGVNKKVNLILSGINAGGSGLDTSTPWYVTSSTTYLGFFTPQRQDVLNGVKDCTTTTGVPWKGTTSATFKGPGTTITVTTTQTCCSTGSPFAPGTIVSGDMIWVGATGSGNDQNFTITSRYGTPANVLSSTKFTYTVPNAVTVDCLTCSFIGTAQSSPVPYELPYLTAWEAFMAAANLHFNPNYAGAGSQLGYVRSGTWSGGESFAYCTTDPGGYNGLTGMDPPYGLVSNLDNTNTWTSDYQKKVNHITSLSPTMVRYWPVDTVDNHIFYPDTMAGYARNASYTNGFGSQGLSLLDENSAGACASTVPGDWCNLFSNTYYKFGMPLELQQISISNPDINPCNPTQCGVPPNKFSGDMRGWLPFAVSKGATVFEVYYQDLGLAYDPNFCSGTGVSTCSGTMYHCYVPAASNVTPALECGWFNEVGKGATTCPGGCYSTAIDQAHGPH